MEQDKLETLEVATGQVDTKIDPPKPSKKKKVEVEEAVEAVVAEVKAEKEIPIFDAKLKAIFKRG